jgi:hypothetical protein
MQYAISASKSDIPQASFTTHFTPSCPTKTTPFFNKDASLTTPHHPEKN